MDAKGPRCWRARVHADGFRAALHLKDLRIVEREAQAMGISLPQAARVTAMFQQLVDRRETQRLDNAAVY